MLNIIAEGKKYKLSSEQVVTVKRINVRDYYLLIASLLIYKIALENISEIAKIKKISEYIKFARDNNIDIAKVKVEFDNMTEILKGCVDIDINKLEQPIIIEILNKVMEFNSVKLSWGGKELESIDELNDELEHKIGTICNLLHLLPEEVLMMNNYDVCILMREVNRMRIQYINDVRLAYHGDKNNYIKYTRGLMGEIVYSGDDIQKNPKLLKEMVH